jgi:hypothetical protein
MSFNEVFSIVATGTTAALAAGVGAFAITVVPVVQADTGVQTTDLALIFRATAGGTLGSYLCNITTADAAGNRTATLNISSYLNAGGFNNADTSTLRYVILRSNV